MIKCVPTENHNPLESHLHHKIYTFACVVLRLSMSLVQWLASHCVSVYFSTFLFSLLLSSVHSFFPHFFVHSLDTYVPNVVGTLNMFFSLFSFATVFFLRFEYQLVDDLHTNGIRKNLPKKNFLL